MHCHKKAEQGLMGPLDATAPAQLTNVQGHALLGVCLQLVVVDSHLPLEKQDKQSCDGVPRTPSPFPGEACLPWSLRS